MDATLSGYVKKHYPNSKSDLFAVFIERCNELIKKNAFQGMITQHAWMFLSSYEKLRAKLLKVDIVNMAHLGARAFEEIGGEVVQTTSFVLRKSHIADCKGEYCRLIEPTTQQGKEDMFTAGENRYEADQSNFSKIPGSPVAYWVSKNAVQAFETQKALGAIAEPKQGLATTDNNRFVRAWSEVDFNKIGFSYSKEKAAESGIKWFPLNKGGEFRKWYGNNDFIVNYQHDGAEIKASVLSKYTYLKTPDFVVKNQQYYFCENGTWSAISSGKISVRYSPKGFIISNAGMAIFCESRLLRYIIAFMNSVCVSDELLGVINQTLNFNAGDIEKLPLAFSDKKESIVISLSDDCIAKAKSDWDSYETSWDFKRNPLI